MGKNEVELYGGAPSDTEALHERGCSHYIELYNSSGKPPRWSEVAQSIFDAHPGEYPSPEHIKKRLSTPEFQEELRLRRKENLIANIGPRLLMAEMASSIAREALEEMLGRLHDPDKRSEISNRDLNALLKTAGDMALAADKDVEEVAQAAPVNKGVIVQLFQQLAPERAAVVMAELARQTAAKERESA